jgi:hypothetical protein
MRTPSAHLARAATWALAIALALTALVVVGCRGHVTTPAPVTGPVGLRIVAPGAGAIVRDDATFQVEAVNLADGASVEYRMDGRALSGPIAVRPWTYAWPSASVWDGTVTLEAIARDPGGVILATSAPVHFDVANGQGTLRFVAPPDGPVQGTIALKIEAKRPVSAEEVALTPKTHGDPRLNSIELVLAFVDGVSVHPTWPTLSIDTTHFADGVHHVFAAAYATVPSGVPPPIAMGDWTFVSQNGHALRDVRPRWAELVLAPGEVASIEPHALFTDGTTGAAPTGVEYVSDAPAVATVDSHGAVSAKAKGIASIQLTSGDHKATTRVFVDDARDLPHFARDGGILHAYDPARSIFVRTMFQLCTDDLRATPGLADAAHAAAINALTCGLYQNPADSGRKDLDFAGWRAYWEPWWTAIERGAKDAGFGLVLTGDDIVRTRPELVDTVTNPWAPDAVRLAFARARDSKEVIAVEMCDEVGWGSTPTPTDGRWKAVSPRLGDDAFTRVMGLIHAVPNHPPVTWPVAGLAPAQIAQNWMGRPEIADYASLYWTQRDYRRAYPDGPSLPQVRAAMDVSVLPAAPLLQQDRPALLLIAASGDFYTKGGEGSAFDPRHDRRDQAGDTPSSVAAQVMYAAARGMAGVRVYELDRQYFSDLRARAKVGAQLSTGTGPFDVGTDRWQALASAFRLVERLEPDLLQARASAVDLGSTFVTGARRGPASRVLVAVNFSEAPETVHVDLAPYRDAAATSIARYRLAGATLRTDALADAASDTVTFAPGESIMWVLRPGNVAPLGVAIASPPPDATVSGAVAIAARVSDERRVDRVEMTIDGHSLCTRREPPYVCTWDAPAQGPAAGKWHGVSVVAYDRAGRSSEARAAVLPSGR